MSGKLARWPIVTMTLVADDDLVAVRQRARRIAAAVGFDGQDQVRIATAVSEIARNAMLYARNGRVEFAVEGSAAPQHLAVTVSDTGPGISHLEVIWSGEYRSPTGMGLGLIGARRLMDELQVDTTPGQGTRVRMHKILTRRAAPITQPMLASLAGEMARDAPRDAYAELREQNRELMRSLQEQRRQQDELRALNSELEQTNRGVLALYTELEDKATALREASEVKSRFLSNVSHELRTPIQSVMAITRLLLDRLDGELSVEQERQVRFVFDAAKNLSGIVDMLLDLAKVEAGRMDIRLTRFSVEDLLGGLRGLFKPLHNNPAVTLVFDAGEPAMMLSDEGKIAQILRNLVSNALKFTRAGEVRVSARHDPSTDRMIISVTDTGIGIAPQDRVRVFEEFEQIPNPLQQFAKGTGLGLSIARGLAGLLGGDITLDSEPGRGSTFSVSLPRRFSGIACLPDAAIRLESAQRMLVIDDDESWRYTLAQAGRASGLDVHEAAGGAQGVLMARALLPDVIFLDLSMPDLDGCAVLDALGRDIATREIPVIVVSGAVPERQKLPASLQRALAVFPKTADLGATVERLLGGRADDA